MFLLCVVASPDHQAPDGVERPRDDGDGSDQYVDHIPPSKKLRSFSFIRPAELLIHSYFNIVKREMIDMVPKAISLTLVNYSKENLQRELLQELYKPEVLDDLMKESDAVVSRRKEVVKMVNALNKAEEIVAGV